ncbi:alpha/beta fold hydrolase [Streptomyces sp. NPDC059629]|uniref:alpha/beta fold hydrolase n=1 Tax=Streptomyces sp. NPDC059629 TaxID=3346889 RepID=UPI0036B49129
MTAHLVELKKLDIPFHLIWGAEDPYLTPAVAEELYEHLRTVTTTAVSGAGHWPQADRGQQRFCRAPDPGRRSGNDVVSRRSTCICESSAIKEQMNC